VRWSLAQLLLGILAVAMGLATCRYFWGESAYFDSRVLFSCYLLFLSCASLAAIGSQNKRAWFWRGYAFFGWVYLALVLRAGFGFTPDSYAPNLSRFSTMGVALCFVCAIVSHVLLQRDSHLKPGEKCANEMDR
jgi:hypothetical protein